MGAVTRTVSISAPPDKVWRAMIDVERWPEWASYMHSLRRQDGGPFGMGSRVKVTPKGLPGWIWAVTEYAEGRSYTWETRLAPGVRMVAGHVAEPESGGTKATLWLQAAGALGTLVSPVLGLAFRRNTRLATQGLKAYCERGER